MSEGIVGRKWRWLRHVAWVLGAKVTLILLGVLVFFGARRWQSAAAPYRYPSHQFHHRRQVRNSQPLHSMVVAACYR